MKKRLITFVLSIIFTNTFTQNNYYIVNSNDLDSDTIPLYSVSKDNFIVLGFIQSDSMANVRPYYELAKGYDKEKLKSNTFTPNGTSYIENFVTDIRNPIHIWADEGHDKWNEHFFDPTSYLLYPRHSYTLWYYFIPFMPEEYSSLLKKIYPEPPRIWRYIPEIEHGWKIYGNCMIAPIKYHKFLCLLVKVNYMNFIEEQISSLPFYDHYNGHENENGLYVKVLIPLDIDEEKKQEALIDSIIENHQILKTEEIIPTNLWIGKPKTKHNMKGIIIEN